ncbi:hypothetical protein GQ55_3G045100 [Panicum hallii var. hallii]|uniref:Uncharacterized protein n=1 Tax=Panicum hallii var. hallii TaxID=1504633 RepID=A0A2T7E5Q1_9POAL|nr:hypothetical protein GQ55_3G045100 [Panicum hallii var. hallii]
MEAEPQVPTAQPQQQERGPKQGEPPHQVAGVKGEWCGQSKMEAAKKLGAGAAGKRRHGSAALFVAVDYAFLLAFAGFLAYLVGSRILPSVASSA